MEPTSSGLQSSSSSLRYIRRRLITDIPLEDEITKLSKEVNWLADWYPNTFYSLPEEFSISQSDDYKTGRIFGIDAASCAAVRALSIEPTDICLDLCCAPGNKLLLMAEQAKFVVGVDASKHRLFTTRSLVQKYKLNNICLSLEDGTKFDLKDARNFEAETAKEGRRARKRLRQNPVNESVSDIVTEICRTSNFRGFDRVLVDAECTHDGSVKHVKKQQIKGDNIDESGNFKSPWDGKRDELFELQLRLLTNGATNLKFGGTLVYSTCSADPRQNQQIVEAFLSQPESLHFQLDTIPFDFREANATDVAILHDGHEIKNCACFFNPKITQTSGLFICRLKRGLPQ